MLINCVALIGKSNQPLFINTFNHSHDEQQTLKFHYIAHVSTDIIEQRITEGAKNTDMYLGLLYVLEDFAVFGYVTSSNIKFIVITAVVDAVVKDGEVKQLFKRIHFAYVKLVSNPFYDAEDTKMIKSPKFAGDIKLIAEAT